MAEHRGICASCAKLDRLELIPNPAAVGFRWLCARCAESSPWRDAAGAPDAEAAAGTLERRTRSGTRAAPRASASRAILLVDDDQDLRAVMADILEGEGYPIILAANGTEALAYLRAGSVFIALVLVDLTMPIMNGYEFLRQAEREGLLASVPVVAMTAHSGEVGIRGFPVLRKPFDLNELLEVVRALGAEERLPQMRKGR